MFRPFAARSAMGNYDHSGRVGHSHLPVDKDG
jgi:hypothetical protein